MALAAGAMPDGLGVVQYHSPAVKNKSPLPSGASPGVTEASFNQPNFWINHKGERFADETVAGAFCLRRQHRHPPENGLVIKLADQAAMDYYTNEGPDFFGGHGRKPWPSLPNDLAEDVKAGIVIKANSYDELVKQINEKYNLSIDPKIFKVTVEQVNTAYDKNFDDLFFKERQFLRPFRTGPYYALATYPAALGTVGGIKITKNCEAVDKNFSVIPGLYVVGTDAGGMYGDTYNIIVAGETIGFAVNSGRIAAEHAVKTLVKK